MPLNRAGISSKLHRDRQTGLPEVTRRGSSRELDFEGRLIAIKAGQR